MRARKTLRIAGGLALSAALAIMATGVARADNVVADGDGITPIANNNLSLGNVCVGSTTTRTVPIGVVRLGGGGTQVFPNGVTVTVSLSGVSGAGVSVAMTDTSIVLPNDWATAGNNAVSSDTASATVTVSPTSVGLVSGGVTFSGTGAGVTRTDPMTITFNAITCDTTPPVITPTVTGTQGSGGWYTSDVGVTWSVTDPESAISSSTGCTASTVTTDTSGVSFTCSAISTGGTTTQSVTVKRDATAPSISAALSPLRPAGGWWNITSGAPSVSYTCSDATSGLAGACPAGSTFGEGANQAASGTISDQAGNTAAAGVSDVDVDLTAPVVSGTPSGTEGDNGWYTGDVTVTWTVDGGTSGAGTGCATDTISSDGADQTASCTEATDGAGNPGAGTYSGIDRDATPPTITAAVSPARPSSGWWNIGSGAPTVSFTCTDATSGIAESDCPDAQTLGEGENQSVGGDVTDRAGNGASDSVGNLDVDLTAPSVSYDINGAVGENGWYVGDVTVTWTVTDALSGAAGCAPDTVTADTAGVTPSCTATDAAGNSTTVSTTVIKRDTTAPSISASVSPASPNGSNGWYVTAPTVTYTCADATSGVVSCGPNETLGESGAVQSSSGSAVDAAGNSATATKAGLKVDLSDPYDIVIPGYTDGASYDYGTTAAPTCAATDDASGVAGCSVTGYNPLAGTHTLTATATDAAGRSASRTLTYTVKPWTLKGFYQPVDMSGVWNTVKNGSTVPFKFEVFAGTVEKTDVAVVKSFTQAVVACTTGTEDAVEEVVTTTGGTALRYDTTGGQFINNWSTPKKPGTCYRVTMTTQDGSSLQALFKLK